MEDLTGLGKLADSKLVNKAYNHALSGAVKETGQLATDIAKTFRLFTAPFQLAALAQDRFALWLDQIRCRVPVERQIVAAPSIAGPAIQSLVFLEDDNPLREMFLNLLTKAIDSDHVSEAHPAFAQIIDQLSPDEAVFLKIMTEAGNHQIPDRDAPDKADFPIACLAFPERFAVYVSHLIALNLVEVTSRPRPPEEPRVKPILRQPELEPMRGARTVKILDLKQFSLKPEPGATMGLSAFGQLFATACMSS